MAKQTITGKAFEYALLMEFNERLHTRTNISIVHNSPYKKAQQCFESFGDGEKGAYRIVSSAAVNFLLDIEPRLSNDISKEDILQLEIVSDKKGQEGDVRDVLAVRVMQRWEIGISAKNNHRAVKHSRLSANIDFGSKWIGFPCSNVYFDEIKPIFDNLAQLRKISNRTKTWESLGDYHNSVYVPILNAFKAELLRMQKEYGDVIAQRLIEYLIGNQDFYKVIKGKNAVEIQAYNLHGTLNQPFNSIKPKAKIQKLKFPTRLIEIVYATDSITTLLVSLNEGWQISFRIHNASSRIEPSLKFDINLVSSPHTMFTNHILIGEN